MLPSSGGLFQVPDVAAQAADAREPRLPPEHLRHRVGIEAALLHHEQDPEHVEVAHTVVLGQARLRRQAETGFDRDAAADAGHARTAAQVAGDVANGPPHQRLRAFRGGAVAGAVEPVATDAQLLLPLVRNGIRGGALGHAIEERGFEQRDQRRLRQHAAERPHGRDVGRIVRGRQKRHRLHGREHIIVDEAGTGDRSRMHGFEADGGQVG